MSVKPATHIGVLDRMITQLTETFAAFKEDRHPDISESTYRRVCGDMDMQLNALKFARAELVRAYGDPAKDLTIEGTIRHDSGDGKPPQAN